MLELKIDESEFYDEKQKKIVRIPAATLRLEHSLRSLSKWEEVWETPFFSQTKKTPKQLVSYVRAMSADHIPDETLKLLTREHFELLNEFLSSKRSATWFSDEGEKSGKGPVVTSELIYYWMTAFSIPFECDTWPLKRLMNLIKIAQIKAEQQNPKKGRKPTSQMLSERAALNAKRRAESNSKG